MKVVFHEDFYASYATDPAAAPGRLEAVLGVIRNRVEIVTPRPAGEVDIARAHSREHIERIRRSGLYPIAALAAGGAIQAATLGLTEPSFGLIRPPGHHASFDSCWGFCFFNNMAIALLALKSSGAINTAFVLDIDMHFGDGTVNILGGESWVRIYNPESSHRGIYLTEVERELSRFPADLIGISAGFDNHKRDWGGVLETEDYAWIGEMVGNSARRNGGGYFAILEGGYNHEVLGENVWALLQGMMKPG